MPHDRPQAHGECVPAVLPATAPPNSIRTQVAARANASGVAVGPRRDLDDAHLATGALTETTLLKSVSVSVF